jgi:hypothetical protein
MKIKNSKDNAIIKFSQLNFNLKNEIFYFLPYVQLLEETFYINKSFSVALKFIKLLNYVKNNLKVLIHEINFIKERIKEMKKKLKQYTSQNELIYEICAILLNKKHKRNSTFTFNFSFKIKQAVVFKFILYNKYIKKLNLRNLNIEYNEHNLKTLFESLIKCQNSNLQTLILSKNKIGHNSDDCLYLSKVLKKHNHIIELDIEENEIGFFSSNDFKLLMEGLSINENITKLNISGNFFCYNNENDIKYLENFIENNNSLRTLHIKSSNIGMNKHDIYYLIKIVNKENSVLKELDISDNKLGNKENLEDLKNFFSAIAQNKTLFELNLSGNSLNGKDNFTETNENNNLEIFGKKALIILLKDYNVENILQHICYAIGQNKYLIILDLSNNNFGRNKRNITFLKKAIPQNKKIKKLILLNNYFETKEIQELKELIKKTNKISLII